MSNTKIMGSVACRLGSDPVHVSYGREEYAGRPYAVLHLADAVTLHVNDYTDPAMLRQLAEKALELAAWREAWTPKAVA
ncbi:hypothetical protein AB0M57_04300 [Streptomyces sp. NPDC051597]|uniref:hypothetical protein n=1 Tax=Streptomyces sp. NPDC051597 TaxID=3155049 RepID=UPI0034429B82